MKLTWQIEDADKAAVKSILDAWRDDPFVKKRAASNLGDAKPEVSLPDFWYRVVICLLTTQQRSGPGSAVFRFCALDPFPLSWDVCRSEGNLADLVQTTLTGFGGIRRAVTLGGELAVNRDFAVSHWDQIARVLDWLRCNDAVQAERAAADYIQDNLCGFGPKQARNLLQTLGLTRYEIPIDSRITKWMNEAIGFPVRLTADALSDRHYYAFVSDAIQSLCAESSVYPCILDAAIFASYDKGKWRDEDILW